MDQVLSAAAFQASLRPRGRLIAINVINGNSREREQKMGSIHEVTWKTLDLHADVLSSFVSGAMRSLNDN
jgi:hypothetical protein